MPFALDVPSIASLKAEARALREERARAGSPLSHGQALEAVAHRHGYRDWNTARAALPERIAAPVQVGNRVDGTYLGQPFRGTVIGVILKGETTPYEVTIRFDEPVDVVTSELFSAFRQRVTATVDLRGVSLARLGNGQPQMQFRKI